MDDQGLAAAARRPDVRAKTLPLPLQVARHPVVVQAGLADRDHARVLRELDQLFHTHRRSVLLVRMDSDAREKVVVLLRQREHLGKPGEIDRDAQGVGHSVRPHFLAYFLELPVELGKIKMAVRIHQARERNRAHGWPTRRRYCSSSSSTNSFALSGCLASARACASPRKYAAMLAGSQRRAVSAISASSSGWYLTRPVARASRRSKTQRCSQATKSHSGTRSTVSA